MSTYHHINRSSHLHKNLSKQYRITHGQPFDHHRLKDHHSTNATQFISSFDSSNLSLINLHRSYKEHSVALPSNIDSRLEDKSSLSSDDLDQEFQFQTKRLNQHQTFHRPLQVANGDKTNKRKKKYRIKTSEFVDRSSDSTVKSNLTTTTDQSRKRTINSKIELFRAYNHFQSSMADIRNASWRKLRANITPFHYDNIQQFQRDRQQHIADSVTRPIIISPLIKETEDNRTDVNNVESCLNESSVFSRSTSSDLLTEYLLTSTFSNQTLESAGIRSIIKDENENFKPDQNDSNHRRFSNDVDLVESILHRNSSVVPITADNENSSFYPLIKSKIRIQQDNIYSEQLSDEYLMDRSQSVSQSTILTTNKFLFIPSKLNSCNTFKTRSSTNKPLINEKSRLVSELTTDSLTRSIQEISLLIRQLLQLNTNAEEKLTLQTTITTQLCILLTYFTQSDHWQIFNQLPQKVMIHAMTSTQDDEKVINKMLDAVEMATKSDSDNSNIRIDTNYSQIPSFEYVHPIDSFDEISHSSHNSKNLESNSSGIHLEVSRNLDPRLISTKQLSQSELLSNSGENRVTYCLTLTAQYLHLVPLHQRRHQLFRSLSDTCMGSIHQHHHLHQQRQILSSSYRSVSISEPDLSSWLKFGCSKFFKHSNLIQPKLTCFVELESSNTYLEASTEFTPDFFLSTMNNSKHDEERTERFGIDRYNQAAQPHVFSSINDEHEKQKLSVISNSQDEQNQDSLDLLMEEGTCIHSFDTFVECSDVENISLHNSKLFDLQISIRSINEENVFSTNLKNDNTSLLINDQIFQFYSFSRIEYNSSHRQYQSPIFSIDMNNKIINHEKRNAYIRLQRRRIQSSVSHRVAMIGKRVRIKSNSPSIFMELSQGRNNNYHDALSTESLVSLSTQMNTARFQRGPRKSKRNFMWTKSAQMMNVENNRNNSLLLREMNKKFDRNISLAQSILQMFDETTSQIESNVAQTELLHFHIHQFLIEFNRRVLLDRKMKYKSKSKHHKYYQRHKSLQLQSISD